VLGAGSDPDKIGDGGPLRKGGQEARAIGKVARERRAEHSESDNIHAVVLSERDEQGNLLVRELQRLRVRVRTIWPPPDVLPSDADVLYCEYNRELPRKLPWAPGDAKSALVVILPSHEPIDPEILEHATPDAVLARPFSANAVVASFVLARSQFRYQQRLRSKVDRLDENLRAMRVVERAKAILMSTRDISGDEAYKFIRGQAMDRRVSVGSLAAAIVSSFELLGPTLK
jgi:AmiR/NasT family two-component response regulator